MIMKSDLLRKRKERKKKRKERETGFVAARN
jgi:hypothetical protein